MKLPDSQRVYMEALEDAFSEWLEENEEAEPRNNAERDYLVHEWNKIDQNALTFGPEYLEEAYGPDIEEGIEVMNLAMEKNMAERIRAMERFLQNLH